MNLQISYLQSYLSNNLQAVLIYPRIYNLMNQQLDLPTLSFAVTTFTTTMTGTITASSYFCRLARLWNALPITDLTLSISVINISSNILYGLIF